MKKQDRQPERSEGSGPRLEQRLGNMPRPAPGFANVRVIAAYGDGHDVTFDLRELLAEDGARILVFAREVGMRGAGSIEETREPSEGVVHIVFLGRAYCGQPGIPADWPEGHRWVPLKKRADATCSACIQALNDKGRGIRNPRSF